MKEKRIITLICVMTVLAIAIISLDCGIPAGNEGAGRSGFTAPGELVRRVQSDEAGYVIMIDPGHGGMDGGASSSDGALEKDINLAIAKELAAAAEQYRCTVIMTRETDEWLCDTDEGSIRSRKTADLMARRELIRKYEPDMTVSIHLNSFKEDPSVKGAQVFYPAGSGSQISGADSGGQAGGDAGSDVMQQCRQLAESMQRVLNETLQPDDPRTAMTRDGVFLFREVAAPMIIVECGFMSNPEEAGRLKTEQYQQEVAQHIMDGIAEFAGLEKAADIQLVDSRGQGQEPQSF